MRKFALPQKQGWIIIIFSCILLACVFGSHDPHEVFGPAKCGHEFDVLLARNDLTPEDNAAVLGGNALNFYRPGL